MRWVAVDVETTGLLPGVHNVWEVALVGDDGQELSWLVEDVKLGGADPKALEVGGFWARWDVSGAEKTPASVVARCVSKATAGKVIVGANPMFDIRFLDELLRRHNRPAGWHYSPVDVKAMAAGWLAGRADVWGEEFDVSLPWRSDDLSLACGVEPPSGEDRHTALGDARWAARWFAALTGKSDEVAA